MLGKTLQARLLIPVSAFVLTVILGGAFVFSSIEGSRIHGEIAAGAEQQSDSVLKILGVTDALVMQQVHSAMQMLIERGKALGGASLGPEVQVKDKTVPSLLLGGKSQVGNYELVDGLVRSMGGTATLFVKSGDAFVRVATNVISNNVRAVGTMLDPNGKVIAAIRAGNAYYGVVDILGEPYLTGYAPIRDAQNEIIGVWYVGYKVDMQAIKDVIAKGRLLRSGFVAVMDARGQARFHPSHVSAEDVQSLAKEGRSGWIVSQKPFEQWGFNVLTAYPQEEVSSIARGRVWGIILVGGFSSFLLIMIIANMLRRLVLQPLGGEPDRAAASMQTIANGDLSVEIKTSKDDSSSLMASLKTMQMKLKNMSSAIHENAETLNQQVLGFDKLTQDYATHPTEEGIAELLRTAKKMGRTVDVLGKSVSRFKL